MKKFINLAVLIIFLFSNSGFTKGSTLIFPHLLMDSYVAQETTSQYGISYSEHYLATHPLAENEQQLITHFEEAQKYYLVGSLDLARIHYKKVVIMAYLDDWKHLHRKAIALSMIRLAELDLGSREHWLKEAAGFGSDIDFKSFKLPKDIFSNLNKINEPTFNWEISVFSKEFDFILINGREVDLKKIKKVILSKSSYRIVFLSKVYKPHVMNVSYQQVPLLEPVKIPFVSGSCSKPNLDFDRMNNEMQILFPDCHLVYKNQKWVSKNDKNIELTPTYSNPSTFTNRFDLEEKPFYKKPWFISAAVVALGVGIYLIVKDQKQKKGASSPSSTVIGEY